MKYIGGVNALFLMLLLVSCSEEEKHLAPKNANETGIFTEGKTTAPIESHSSSDNHNHSYQIEVVEILQATKYSYLKVKEIENEEPYWVATIKDEFMVGEQYIYHDRLLKNNFKSVEYNRVFDKIYLISKIMSVNAHNHSPKEQKESVKEVIISEHQKASVNGVVSIASIVKNPEEFSNKTIKVFGEVVKVNQNIMERNWIHLKDGTADDYDFVITSESNIPVGHSVAFEGTLSINRDFGAGYSYDIIMENAKSIQ